MTNTAHIINVKGKPAKVKRTKNRLRRGREERYLTDSCLQPTTKRRE